ncbi:ras family domain-containing protein [Ditylenchus destructor]|uniref:Ras family domain-containing protein n=1 Tax=Ditylenchus destructor TaxID=166010 RepID=A0AAD4N5Z8_9BILA|nr:ras family domain-containing protein [Ditylenchus destructor]
MYSHPPENFERHSRSAYPRSTDFRSSRLSNNGFLSPEPYSSECRQHRSSSMYNDGGGYSPHMRAASMYGRPNWGRTPQRMGSVTPTARRRRLPATPNACSTPQADYSPLNGVDVDSEIAARVSLLFGSGAHSSTMHRKIYEIRSAENAIGTGGSALDTSSLNMTPPLRSQSFRHRARPHVSEVRHFALDEVGSQERRRSTPTVSRRCSLQRNPPARTDVWPEPKQMSEIEERFLRLPDSEDYTRVRQFKIDNKGVVVSRGDSFRRKRSAAPLTGGTPKSDMSTSPFPVNDLDGMSQRHTTGMGDSRSTSVSSEGSAGALAVASKISKSISANNNTNRSHSKTASLTDSPSSLECDDTNPSTSHPSYKIYVLGQTGSGKTALINQFISSEYRNAFADDIEENTDTTTVSINIGGHECDLAFFETDPETDCSWKDEKVQAFLLVYSIDRKSSFRSVVTALEHIREVDKSTPIILAGNKIDLERKRAVSSHEVKCVALTYDIAHFEISVALNHDVDDLLVGIVAEIKESFAGESVSPDEKERTISTQMDGAQTSEPDDFREAIRRFSQRKKRQLSNGTALAGLELETGKCANLNPAGLFAKIRQWRRGMSKC